MTIRVVQEEGSYILFDNVVRCKMEKGEEHDKVFVRYLNRNRCEDECVMLAIKIEYLG